MLTTRALWSAYAVGLLCSVAAPAAAEEPVEIEVRGPAIAVAPRAPNVAGSVIRRERLQGAGTQATDVLRTQPGVEVSETGGFASSATASLRGATAAQTPIYLAGVRLNDDVGGAADLGSVPLWFLERIEIYRSNAPLAGDQLGIGGAIFFDPRRPRGTELAAGGLLGSFGARALWSTAGVGNARGSTLLGVRVDRADNDYRYVNDNGTRFDPTQAHESVLRNADVRQLDFWSVSTMRLGDSGRADLVLNVAEREQGIPGIALFPTFEARQRSSRRLAAVSTRASCGSACQIETTSAAVFTETRYADPLGEIGLGAAGLKFAGARTEDALSARFGVGRRITVAPALRFAFERLDVTSSGHPSTHARRSFARAALQGQLDISERWTLYGLGAGECHGTSRSGGLPWAAPGDADPLAGPGACRTPQAVGRVGASWNTSPVTLLTTIGRYSRVPTLAELYGTSGVVRGNTDLVPEQGVSFELGARSNASLVDALGGLSFDVFGFAREVERLIYYRRSAIGYVRPYNLDSARILGLEALLTYAPAPLLHCELSATLSDPRDTSPGKLVNEVLPHRARLVLAPRAELRSRRHAGRFNGARLAISYFYESQRFADQAGLIVIPAQGSLGAESELVVLGEHLSVRARLTNILDQTRFDLIGYPLPGRAVYLSTEIRL